MVGPRIVLAQLSRQSGIAKLGTRFTHADELEGVGALPGLGGRGEGAREGGRADKHIDEPHDV